MDEQYGEMRKVSERKRDTSVNASEMEINRVYVEKKKQKNRL